MTRSPRRILAAAVATGLAGMASVALLTGPTAAEPAPEVAADPAMCIDLSPLALPSVCLYPLL